MKKKEIKIDTILAPIPGENPAGEDLRYTKIYDGIKEARREDDALDRGDWKHEIKKSDWNKVIELSVEALVKKTKDLQIAAWFAEALINTEGFSGLLTGLKILNGFLRDYWDHVYPVIEDGDLDFRAGPIEFINEKLSISIKKIPLTDPGKTPGYSLLKWQQSRQVPYEADIRNQYGDVDEGKKKKRAEGIAEGKLPPEDFDIAVEYSSKDNDFYESMAERLTGCREELKIFDEIVDEKFGSKNAPGLAAMQGAIENCEDIIMKILKEKKEREPTPEPEPETEEVEAPQEEESEPLTEDTVAAQKDKKGGGEEKMAAGQFQLNQFSDAGSMEKSMWKDALKMLKNGGIKKALEQLYRISCSMPSVREKNRYRLLMTKLCLKAERTDLARPMVEELYALIEELHLEQWESPMWIAEVLTALYQCLIAGTPSDEDKQRANNLFKKICTTDVTKAMI